ncbi:transposase [Mucilaginibacter sp. UYCu711]|uniref:transposase n=1 Tax=Mucilaginibacter sp. UYCu711 TaxID=3156339 RepID=UPI003D2091AB
MNKKHDEIFKGKVVKEYLSGDSLTAVALKWGLSRSLLTRWVDRYNAFGDQGLLPKERLYQPAEFKLKVVERYLSGVLSLRDCCSEYGIATESIVLSWVNKYKLLGVHGLREQRGRPKLMKKDSPSKKTQPLTRLEELEKENLYLKAENELLKKLEALAQAKKAQKKKR